MTDEEFERLHASREARIAHNRATLKFGMKGPSDEPPSDIEELGAFLDRLLHHPGLDDDTREAVRRALKLLRSISLRRPREPASLPEESPSEAKVLEGDIARLVQGAERIELGRKSRDTASVRRHLEDAEARRLLAAVEERLPRRR